MNKIIRTIKKMLKAIIITILVMQIIPAISIGISYWRGNLVNYGWFFPYTIGWMINIAVVIFYIIWFGNGYNYKDINL